MTGDVDTESREERTDAFGAALRDQYEDEAGYEIVERDDGWIGPNGVEGYFTDYEEWPAIVRDPRTVTNRSG